LVGYHLNLLTAVLAVGDQLPKESEKERAAAEAFATFREDGFGYFLEMAEVGLRATDDGAIARHARAEGRAVVTENVADFADEVDLALVVVLKRSLPAVVPRRQRSRACSIAGSRRIRTPMSATIGQSDRVARRARRSLAKVRPAGVQPRSHRTPSTTRVASSDSRQRKAATTLSTRSALPGRRHIFRRPKSNLGSRAHQRVPC
jgi:hypothetical protein